MSMNDYIIPASDGQDLLENIRLAMDHKPKLAVYLKRYYGNKQLKDGLRNARASDNGLKTILKIPLARLKSRSEIYSYFIEIINKEFHLIQIMITITPNRTMPAIRIKVNITI